MKNINTYILTAIVSLVLVVATSFLMTAADEPIRQAGYYLPWCSASWPLGPPVRLVCLSWTTRSAPARRNAHAAA